MMDLELDSVDRWYAEISRHFSKLLDWQFTCTDNEIAALWLHRVLTLFSRSRLCEIIEHVQPQLIITTHAFLSYATARANERLRKRVPLVFQLTDLGQLHMTWFTEKQADAYLAPTREIFSQALAHGIAETHLYLTGSPVRRQFFEVSNTRNETFPPLHFAPPLFTPFLQDTPKCPPAFTKP